jgi:FMN-dependent dehydrogenase
VAAAVMAWGSVFPNPGLSWDDLPILRELTDLPILLKGIVHPKDAKRAVHAGVNGIVVSNHGGRQVDGAIATLDALPAVLASVPGDFPVLLDSGVRTGADAVKALALGARAVLLGRPYVWGLALGGAEGGQARGPLVPRGARSHRGPGRVHERAGHRAEGVGARRSLRVSQPFRERANRSPRKRAGSAGAVPGMHT